MKLRVAVVAAPVVASAALAACGGGGGGSTTAARLTTGAATTETPTEDFRVQLAFETGTQACAAHPPKTLAGFYGSAVNPEAIARAYGKASGETPARQEAARRGCLSVLAKKR